MRQFFKTIIVRILTWEAATLLRKQKPFIIAVTGSVGKTGAKDAIYHVLKDEVSARKSEKSFNSELGVPLTVLGLANAWRNPFFWVQNIVKGFLRAYSSTPYPKLLVLEIGADHPGDIAQITKWMHPDIAVVTRLPDRPVHVEYFDSPEAVKKEKGELVRAINTGGMFIANGDDPAVLALNPLTPVRMLTYGTVPGVAVRGSHPKIDEKTEGDRREPIGMLFHVTYQDETVPVRLPGVLGIQPCMAALAAIATGAAYGASLSCMAEALTTFTPAPGRMRIIPGKNGSIIIDDSYNSSPIAAEAALDTLKTIQGNHKIALLGDMLELGQYAQEEHWRIGRIAGSFVDELVTVGKRAGWIAEAAKTAGLPEGRIHIFNDSNEAGEWAAAHVGPGDIVLAKGSQGSGENMIRMERAVKRIMAHPEDASELLVRQEKEWLAQYSASR